MEKAREKAQVDPLPRTTFDTRTPRFRIRGGMSIPELAEQMGHSPQMTVGTYAHVIRELKGEPMVSSEDQIEQARGETGGRLVDVDAV